jgi:cytoskeletal protein RodZ
MATIGPQLRAAREHGGITVADAARRLHMRAMFVDALEREEWRTVGEPVYVRGFIRNYARLVGIEPQSLVDAFNAEIELQAPVAAAEPSFALSDRRPRFRYPQVLAALSIVALLLVAKVVWTIVTPNAVGHDELRPSQAAALTAQNSGTINSVLGANVALGASAHQPASGQGVDVRLQLTQPCWLSVSVDGKRVVYQTLPAGTVKEFRGAREITLRAGNAGGVVATIDGQAIGTLGGPGQVQDRVFAVRTPQAGQTTTHE